MAEKGSEVTFLEGLGYTAALMIGAAGVTQQETLRFFNVAGLVFGLIAVVRLLAMNIRLGRPSPGISSEEVPQPRSLEEVEQEQENEEQPDG